MKETEFFLIASALNNVLRTNYIKAKIDNIQRNNKNNKCSLCINKLEMINLIISKLAQKKYKTRSD